MELFAVFIPFLETLFQLWKLCNRVQIIIEAQLIVRSSTWKTAFILQTSKRYTVVARAQKSSRKFKIPFE